MAVDGAIHRGTLAPIRAGFLAPPGTESGNLHFSDGCPGPDISWGNLAWRQRSKSATFARGALVILAVGLGGFRYLQGPEPFR